MIRRCTACAAPGTPHTPEEGEVRLTRIASRGLPYFGWALCPECLAKRDALLAERPDAAAMK